MGSASTIAGEFPRSTANFWAENSDEHCAIGGWDLDQVHVSGNFRRGAVADKETAPARPRQAMPRGAWTGGKAGDQKMGCCAGGQRLSGHSHQ